MTAKNRNTGELQIVKWGMDNLSYRALLLVLLFSITPLGKPIWRAAGWVDSGDTTANAASVATLARIDARLGALEDKVNGMSRTLDSVSAFVDGMKRSPHL